MLSHNAYYSPNVPATGVNPSVLKWRSESSRPSLISTGAEPSLGGGVIAVPLQSGSSLNRLNARRNLIPLQQQKNDSLDQRGVKCCLVMWPASHSHRNIFTCTHQTTQITCSRDWSSPSHLVDHLSLSILKSITQLLANHAIPHTFSPLICIPLLFSAKQHIYFTSSIFPSVVLRLVTSFYLCFFHCSWFLT